MKPYKLTIEDIDKLQAQGLDMTGVPEGAVAEPFELDALNITQPPMTADQAGLTPTQATYDASIQAGATPATAPQSGGFPVTTPTPSPTMGAATAGASPLMGLLDLSTPIPQDPFENLSRSQRTMIGFAALKDAGMALQGKEGNAVSGVMKDITNRADMERKRQAAVAQQQMLGSLFGGAGGGAGGAVDMTSIEAMTAHRAKLAQAAVMFPDRAAGLAVQIADLDKNISRIKDAKTSLQSTSMGIAAAEALLNSPDLGQLTGLSGFGNQFLEKIKMAPKYSVLMSYVDQLSGLDFLEAYQALKGSGPITDIEGAQAKAARSRLLRALNGTPQDVRDAAQAAVDLFAQARSQNPLYSADVPVGDPPPAPQFTEDEVDEFLNP